MPYVPKWLEPPDFLGYARGGSEAGLGASRISQAAREAQERTRLGYAQLQAEQNANMARIAAMREAQALNAAESLRSHRALEAYRGTESEHALAQEEAARAALGLQERKQLFDEQQAFRPRVESVGGSLVEFDPRTRQAKELLRPKSAGLSEFDKGELSSARKAKAQAEMNLADPMKITGRKQYEKIIAEANAVIRRFQPQAPLAQPGLPSLGTPPPGEVWRKAADGRTAVFDANTKAFIRWAQ